MSEEQAAADFVERLHGPWSPARQEMLERRLAGDAAYADAYRRAQESVEALRVGANSPEMMRFREQAIAYARRSSVRRWMGPGKADGARWRWAAAAAVAMIGLAAWQLSPWGYRPGRYTTHIGEQRTLDLADRSRIALDAATKVAIRYSPESRTIELLEGQAQFSVAKDPTRPFRVQVGDRTIVALGTVFTVDYTDRELHVAMLDGRVAVGQSRAPSADMVELSAGEELKVASNGRSTVMAKADLEAATAWRNGKVVFRTERLQDAVRRMNRYSHVRLKIADAGLGEERVSGVFEATDTEAFVASLQLALPVAASHPDADTVLLSRAGSK